MISDDFSISTVTSQSNKGESSIGNTLEKTKEFPEKKCHIALIQIGHCQWRMAVARNALAILTASLII
jgi:hypothetical protein